MKRPHIPALLPMCLALTLACGDARALQSPNKELNVKLTGAPDHTLTYTIERNGQPVLLPSPLGLLLAGADFIRDLKLVKTTPVKVIAERATMAVAMIHPHLYPHAVTGFSRIQMDGGGRQI